MHQSFKIRIEGLVQGVGFRPYVYNLAQAHKLVGSVCNDGQGVIIQVKGDGKHIQAFYLELIRNPPPLSRIGHHEISKAEPVESDVFEIRPSEIGQRLNLQLTPDFGICGDCRNEIRNGSNRRSGYAFTTCVNCGPRWSITKTFPFEREHTSIREFTMCPECRKEYIDPSNRRFHSQTNSCPACGMSLELINSKGDREPLTGHSILKRAVELIEEGNILAIKNTGGYLLCCDATRGETIKKLRQNKNRPAKPLALLYPDLERLEKDADLDETQKESLLSSERPIVLLKVKRSKCALPLDDIAPGLDQIGVMLPYSGILELLASHLKGPIVATSGNLHGSPIISEKKKAEQLLGKVANYFVHHDLTILNTQDDSVIKFSFKRKEQTVFRRSRGYAPNFGNITFPGAPPILAMGSHLKGSIAYLPNDYLYVSQYLGNMDHFEVCERFEHTVSSFLDVFRQQPSAVLVDMHPAYHSSLFGKDLARRWEVPSIGVQHHKAHFASVLGEHQLFQSAEPVLGVIWDGVGYGEDAQIWGGEFFLYHNKIMERAAHFDYFAWLAADKMSREPRLSLFSLLEGDLPQELRSKFSIEEFLNYTTLLKRKPLQTSSVGRIFDAVASLLGLCHQNSFEGEAAMLLEGLVHDYDLGDCKSYLDMEGDIELDAKALIRNVYKDWKENGNPERVSTNFHFTMAKIVQEMAERSNVKRVACSGGVFQNTTLTDMIKDLAEGRFEVYFNRTLAPNDENISVGQIMYYLNELA